MSGSEERKKSKLIGVRVTPEEFREISQKADALNLSAAEMMRSLALKKRIKNPRLEKEAALALSAELRSAGVNLNQLAKVANRTGNVVVNDELADLRKVILKLWQSLN